MHATPGPNYNVKSYLLVSSQFSSVLIASINKFPLKWHPPSKAIQTTYNHSSSTNYRKLKHCTKSSLLCETNLRISNILMENKYMQTSNINFIIQWKICRDDSLIITEKKKRRDEYINILWMRDNIQGKLHDPKIRWWNCFM